MVPTSDRFAAHAPVSAGQRLVAGNSRIVTGQIAVSAVDAESRIPIDRLRVRAASVTRLADRSDGGKLSIQLNLTPDHYALLVSSPGYEPVELPSVEVLPSESKSVGPVELRPGTSKVLGIVTGNGWQDGELRAELLGDGRRPCAMCALGCDPSKPGESSESRAWFRATPCPTCGYREESSIVSVQAGGRFTFENLTSGAYALRLIDAQDRAIAEAKAIELHAEEEFPAELPYVSSRVVRAEILDTDGVSLAAEWARMVRGRQKVQDASEDEVPVVEAGGPSPQVQLDFVRGDSQLARSYFLAPTPPGRAWQVSISCCGRIGSGRPRTSDDRPRSQGETLRPALSWPTIEPMELSSYVDEEGLVRVESVPSLDLTIKLTCDSFSATAVLPRSLDEGPLRIRLIGSKIDPGSAEAGASGHILTFREHQSSAVR